MHQVQKPLSPGSDFGESGERADRLTRYQAVLRMWAEWQSDQSGYDERIWPELVRNIEADRLSPRRRFGD